MINKAHLSNLIIPFFIAIVTISIVSASKNVSGTMVSIYVEQDGRLIDLPTDVPMIHGQGTSGGGQGGPHGQTEKFPDKLTFFVGTEEQWREAIEKQPAS